MYFHVIPVFRLALVQLSVTGSKADNLGKCAKLVAEAASCGAKVVALPECFNSPYGVSKRMRYKYLYSQVTFNVPFETLSLRPLKKGLEQGKLKVI